MSLHIDFMILSGILVNHRWFTNNQRLRFEWIPFKYTLLQTNIAMENQSLRLVFTSKPWGISMAMWVHHKGNWKEATVPTPPSSNRATCISVSKLPSFRGNTTRVMFLRRVFRVVFFGSSPNWDGLFFSLSGPWLFWIACWRLHMWEISWYTYGWWLC